MIQTGVASTDWRRSARRNLLLRSDVSAMRVFDALRDHHLETALDLRVARALECGQRGITVQIHLALQRRASALDAGFAVQRPAAEQILLQRDAAIARRGGTGRGLQIQVHPRIVREEPDFIPPPLRGDPLPVEGGDRTCGFALFFPPSERRAEANARAARRGGWLFGFT